MQTKLVGQVGVNQKHFTFALIQVYSAEIEGGLEEFFIWVIDSIVEGTGCLDEVGRDPGRVAHDEIDREWELQVLSQRSVESQIFLLIGLIRRFLQVFEVKIDDVKLFGLYSITQAKNLAIHLSGLDGTCLVIKRVYVLIVAAVLAHDDWEHARAAAQINHATELPTAVQASILLHVVRK